MTEDREELQKLWAAMIARLLTGDLPTVRREWIELVSGLEIVDAGILELLTKVENRGESAGDSLFIRALSSDFSSRWPKTKLHDNDFLLALNSLEVRGLISRKAFLQKRPDGSWPPTWDITPLGLKIVEITTPPAGE